MYTSLAKALVEFVANAYDADSPNIRIKFDSSKIASQAAICRTQYDLDLAGNRADGKPKKDIAPLEKRTLDPSVEIVLEDAGDGMTKKEMEDKFLVIGRRRRDESGNSAYSRSGKRLLMGRKGLGKASGYIVYG